MTIRRLLVLLAAGLATQSGWASPSLRGATGLVLVPDANVGGGTEAFIEDGSLGTVFQTLAFGISELGLYNGQGRNYYNAKVQVMPDVTNDEFWLPAVALGIRGVSSSNDQREYYLAISKKFTYPNSYVTFGLTRHEHWRHGTQSAYWGLDWPLSKGMSLVGDWRAGTGQFNVGLHASVTKNVVVFGDVLGMFHKAMTAKPRDVVGACYQTKF